MSLRFGRHKSAQKMLALATPRQRLSCRVVGVLRNEVLERLVEKSNVSPCDAGHTASGGHNG